jgi:hypothetical protein
MAKRAKSRASGRPTSWPGDTIVVGFGTRLFHPAHVPLLCKIVCKADRLPKLDCWSLARDLQTLINDYLVWLAVEKVPKREIDRWLRRVELSFRESLNLLGVSPSVLQRGGLPIPFPTFSQLSNGLVGRSDYEADCERLRALPAILVLAAEAALAARELPPMRREGAGRNNDSTRELLFRTLVEIYNRMFDALPATREKSGRPDPDPSSVRWARTILVIAARGLCRSNDPNIQAAGNRLQKLSQLSPSTLGHYVERARARFTRELARSNGNSHRSDS